MAISNQPPNGRKPTPAGEPSFALRQLSRPDIGFHAFEINNHSTRRTTALKVFEGFLLESPIPFRHAFFRPPLMDSLRTQFKEALCDRDFRALFMRAARSGNLNRQNGKGDTLLMLATRMGNFGVVNALCAANADANACNIDGKTALIIAAENGDIKILIRLLSHNAHTGICDRYGKSAIMRARECGRNDCADRISSWPAAFQTQ